MCEKLKTIAIIQARMGSTRLPGKMLKEIVGKPMLWHLVKRVKIAKCVDDVVVAATVNKEDDALEEFAVNNDLGVYRGSENDIVDRYFRAAKKYNAAVVVRLWGDCPLIDPDLIDKVLSDFIDGDYDYANNFNPPTYPFGMNFEAYLFKSLERIWQEAEDKFYREYPFEYIYAHHDSFKTLYDKHDVDLSDIHLTVDYAEDLELVSEIFKNLHGENNVFHMKDILDLINKYPELKGINKGLERNVEFSRDKKLRGR